MKPMRSRRLVVRSHALLGGLVAGVATTTFLAACGASPGPSAGGSTTDPTTTTTTTLPATTTTSSSTTTSTTTTTTLPVDMQPTAEGAASAFLDGWVAGSRSDSGKVATAAAVDELFAAPYQGQPLVPRGCNSAAFPPVVCSYGPTGGSNPTDKLYEITVASHHGGWYVTAVLVEQF